MASISMTTATLGDPAAMAEFLAPIPNGGELGKILQNGKPIASRAYDDDSWTARFVASNGVTVQCFTVADITIDQAEMIAMACVDVTAWQESEFRAMVEQILDPTPDPPFIS